MPKPNFRRFVFALSGDLTTEDPQHIPENIKRWVSLRHGRVVDKMQDIKSITHVITTEAEYKKKPKDKHRFLKHALQHKRRVKIIKIDWLEFSILKGRLLKEADYGFREIDARRKREQDQLKRELYEYRQRVLEEKGNYVNSTVYRPYQDQTFFEYQITLTCDDEDNGLDGERYVLTLFQSIATPHTYLVAYKYYRSRRHTQPIYQRQSTLPVRWAQAWQQFRTFFLLKTGVDWNDRVVAAWERANKCNTTTMITTPSSPVGASTMDGVDKLGNDEVRKKKLFRYNPPTGGKAMGAGFNVPDGFFEAKCKVQNENVPPPQDKEDTRSTPPAETEEKKGQINTPLSTHFPRQGSDSDTKPIEHMGKQKGITEPNDDRNPPQRPAD